MSNFLRNFQRRHINLWCGLGVTAFVGAVSIKNEIVWPKFDNNYDDIKGKAIKYYDKFHERRSKIVRFCSVYDEIIGLPPVNPGLFKIGLQVSPNTQIYRQHYYERVINAELHPVIDQFMNLDLDRIAERYCILDPSVDSKALKKLLKYKPKHFAWSGTDLVNTNANGIRQLCVIETNSCPSGQKSMPDKVYNMENLNGYQKLMRNTFKPRFEEHLKNNSELSDDKYKFAVIYDKNEIEAYGYAHGMLLLQYIFMYMFIE